MSGTPTCSQTAITAANIAKTRTIGTDVYTNQIFTIGLLGGVTSGDLPTVTTTLNAIQNSGYYSTSSPSNLLAIYNQIFAKLSWTAKNLTVTETIPSGFTISSITKNKGTVTPVGQVITWNVDFLNPETITLNYTLTPPSDGSLCGTKTVSASTLNYTNSSCLADSKTVTTPEVTIPCLTLGASSKIDVTCFGTSTGSVTAGTVTNSVGTVNYSWKNASNTVVGTTATVNNLPTGTYTLTITDNCFSKSNSVTILEPASALTVIKTSQTDVLCFGTSIGAIDITASGGTGAYTYDWADITGTSNIEDRTGLAAGTYTVTVKDANGCVRLHYR